MKGNLFIISSPSGGGKGTLIKHVLNIDDAIRYSVSFTTRRRREGEEDGRDYFFVSKAEFENKIAKGEFLEYAEVHGNYYGTSASQVGQLIDQGLDVILEIDVQGASQVKRMAGGSVGIFILPPSFEILKKRLTARGTEDPEDLLLRLANSKMEVEKFADFDYVVINSEIDQAIGDLHSIFKSERLRRLRQEEKVWEILESF